MAQPESEQNAASPGASLELAVEVAEGVEIRDVRFFQFAAEHRPELCQDAMCLHPEVEAEGGQRDGYIWVEVRFGLQAIAEEQERPGVTVSAVIRLEYDCADAERFSERHLYAFAETNGVYNAWPYWREFVQNAVARMQLPPLVLPVFRLTDGAPRASGAGDGDEADD